jgi:hypothetical protein
MLQLNSDNSVKRANLSTIEVPGALASWKGVRPKKASWKGINHGQLANLVVNQLLARGFIIKDEKWTLTHGDLGLLGVIEVEPGPHFDWSRLTKGVKTYENTVARGLSVCLYVRHANNGQVALRFDIGGRVHVCDNGLSVDRVIAGIRRKHSENHTLESRVHEGVELFSNQLGSVGTQVEMLANIDLSNREGDHLVLEAAHKGIIPSSLILDVSKEWREPRHPEFKERNGWGLYNAFTELAKKKSPVQQMKIIEGSKAMLLDYATPDLSLNAQSEPEIEIIHPFSRYAPNPSAEIVLA